jgi:hypothetical protein
MSLPLTSANFDQVLGDRMRDMNKVKFEIPTNQIGYFNNTKKCLEEMQTMGYATIFEKRNETNDCFPKTVDNYDILTWAALVKKLLPNYELPKGGGSRRNKRSRKSGRSARRSKSRKNRRTTRKR